MQQAIIGNLIALLIFAACWITNLVKFINCDFETPYKSEVIHAVGVFVPPACVVTVWYRTD